MAKVSASILGNFNEAWNALSVFRMYFTTRIITKRLWKVRVFFFGGRELYNITEGDGLS